MAPVEEIDLYAPIERDVILEVRSSRMKIMPGLTIKSGIDKTIRDGRVHISKLGIEGDEHTGDEHDPTFHGGIDKAVHMYCKTHYPKWRAEFPQAASRFKPGGFGENFVVAQMNERNVCIGDIYSVGAWTDFYTPKDGDGLLLQVSLPRQPCFKLNHRFQLKNFAPKTYRVSRTGWYMRVLREGDVQAGDEIKLIKRKWPKWTIERIQEYLHRNPDDSVMNEELAGIEELGDESRGTFINRAAKQAAKEKKKAGKEEKWSDYRIVRKEKETGRITSFTLEATNPGAEAPDLQLGSHARIKLPMGLLRSYSIVSGDVDCFQLGIALEDNSRGGSRYLVETAKEGEVLQVGRITSDVKPASMASNHVFIVGGIGITAFLSMMEAAQMIHYNFELNYGVRSAEDVPFRERIRRLGDHVKLYDASKGERMNIPAIFKNLPWNSHVYVCGPQRMMDEAMKAAKANGLGEDEVHFEAFAADTTGDPFDVEVANRGRKTLHVAGDESLLEALRNEFGTGEIASSCEVGNCGTCKISLESGKVDHRGTALSEEEKNGSMLSCVSRGIGRIVVDI